MFKPLLMCFNNFNVRLYKINDIPMKKKIIKKENFMIIIIQNYDTYFLKKVFILSSMNNK